MSRTIIAGSRNIVDYDALLRTIAASNFEIIEVVSGGCNGVDTMGERWAKENGIPVVCFPADWEKHGKAAGPIRNQQMAVYADALILLWDGRSAGSASMKRHATEQGVLIFENVLR